MADRVLVTTDDLEQAVRINAQLEAAGFETTLTSSLDDVRQALQRREAGSLVVTGGLHEDAAAHLLALARDRSISTLGLVEATEPDAPGVARRLGLTAWLAKPVDPGLVVATVRRLLERRRLQARTGIVGESPAIQEVLVKIEQMAPVTSTVLLEGESGTGKELVAHAIHDLSPRRGKPFIAVNCAAIPDTLLESELFGHEKGAFTGAAERRLGRFELADGGTLFLDEIANVPLRQQAKLLRVLETGEMERVGSSKTRRVDARVLSATNADLHAEVEAGRFRADLLFRLNTVEIHLPPLRERREDIPPLAAHFLARYVQRYRKQVEGIDAGAIQAMLQYGWPGNVRELDHTIERAVLMARGTQIEAVDLGLASPRASGPGVSQGLEEMSLESVESILIRKALSRSNGNVSQAAEALGLSRGALYRRMEKYGI